MAELTSIRVEYETVRVHLKAEGIVSSHPHNTITSPDLFPGLPADPRAMERMTARIGRIMGEQQFESMDEAQTFLNDYFSKGDTSMESTEAGGSGRGGTRDQ